MELTALRNFPVFASRPSADFISRWRRHIEKTGFPETFNKVSTDKPPRNAQVQLLSEEIKVPLGKRGGERVSCPLCSPTKPKFGTGRMAHFPESKDVRFIGHECAKHYLGDSYRAAERVFAIETKCLEYQAMWARTADKLDGLEAFVKALLIPAKALQFTREYLDLRAKGFSEFLFKDRMHNTGQLAFGQGHRAASTDLDGLVFLAPDFDPARQLEKSMDACRDLRKPLPSWIVEDSECEASKEIIRRGRSAEKALKQLHAIRDRVAEAQKFLAPRNLRTLERWVAGGQSPFADMIFRWQGTKVMLSCTSYKDRYYCELLVHPDYDAPVPKFNDGLEI